MINAWWSHLAITWINDDLLLMKSFGIFQRVISQGMFKLPVTVMCLKVPHIACPTCQTPAILASTTAPRLHPSPACSQCCCNYWGDFVERFAENNGEMTLISIPNYWGDFVQRFAENNGEMALISIPNYWGDFVQRFAENNRRWHW